MLETPVRRLLRVMVVMAEASWFHRGCGRDLRTSAYWDVAGPYVLLTHEALVHCIAAALDSTYLHRAMAYRGHSSNRPSASGMLNFYMPLSLGSQKAFCRFAAWL